MTEVFNHYELAGKGLRVTYDPDGQGPVTTEGQVVLTHIADGAETTFTRSQVRINHDTAVGSLISAVLSENIDADTVYFTLVLPTLIVNKGTAGAPEADITALAIVTVHQGTIVGPQGEKYTATALSGTASVRLSAL